MTIRQNRFAAALRDLTDRSDITLHGLATASGVAASDLSRYRSGKIRVSRVSIARLAAVLPPADGAPLVIAYLQDEIPDGYEDYISITAALGRLAEPSATNLSRWQRALQWVAQQETNPSVSDWLIGTSELVRGLSQPAAETPQDQP